MVPTLPLELNQHIASFLPIYDAMRIAPLDKDFAWTIVARLKREWAATRLQSVYRAFQARARLQHDNPSIAFFFLALRAMRRSLAHLENEHNVSHAASPWHYFHFQLRPQGALVVDRFGGMQFIDNEMDGGWVSLESTGAISTFLQSYPSTVSRLEDVAEYPRNQTYSTGHGEFVSKFVIVHWTSGAYMYYDSDAHYESDASV